jgi:hypothetical protein
MARDSQNQTFDPRRDSIVESEEELQGITPEHLSACANANIAAEYMQKTSREHLALEWEEVVTQIYRLQTLRNKQASEAAKKDRRIKDLKFDLNEYRNRYRR